MPLITPDLCIIGAGSGGLSLAAGAAQMGARVALIEGAEMGGDCLNAGCVPSKTLLAAAKTAHLMRQGAMGVAGTAPEVNFAAIKDHIAATIAHIAPVDSQERFEGFGVHVIRDWARFTGPRELQAGTHTIRARRFVIATGSRPAIPQVPGLETVPYLTNETIFAQRDRPEHLLILGGGPIGVEMAQAHLRLGCRVTLIARSTVLPRDDTDAAEVVKSALRQEGVQIIEGQDVARLRNLPDGLEAVLSDGQVITASHLLLATGRHVHLDGLNLSAAGVDFTAKGVTVTPALRTTNRRVYAVGDAAGGAQFTHVAGAHAGVIIRQVLFGLPARVATVFPQVTYTDPELAQIGLTEVAARAAHGAALTVLRQDFAHNDRAITEGKVEGFLKLMLVKSRPVGVTIVGAQAGELIGLWALAMATGAKVGQVAGMIAPYPTRSEISKRAAGAYFSPKLFDNPRLKQVVRLMQRLLP
jgi:pyruvate/2-oxoglutarate dehydrogenase complex dihydrolipoamide dehydrogenase (E3) component